MIDSDTALGQQFFHITVGQAVPQVPADRHGDHLPREPEASENRRRARGHHHASLPATALKQRNTALPADEQLAPAVEESIEALKLGERDAAAAQLARRCAAVIDQAENPASALRWLGPLLLRALRELRATPAARPAGKPERTAPNRIARLRAEHLAVKRKLGRM